MRHVDDWSHTHHEEQIENEHQVFDGLWCQTQLQRRHACRDACRYNCTHAAVEFLLRCYQRRVTNDTAQSRTRKMRRKKAPLAETSVPMGGADMHTQSVSMSIGYTHRHVSLLLVYVTSCASRTVK